VHPDGPGARLGVLMAHHGKLDEASQYLIARMRSDPARTACIGDCMGGRRLIRHPGNDGFQPHYADLAWPLVTDFLQRRV